MYPHERSLVERMKDRPFALIGVNSDTSLEKIKEVVAEEKISWRSFWNGPEGPDGRISSLWNVKGWPTIYIIDHEGVIRNKNLRGDDLDVILAQLFGSLPQGSH